VGIFGNKIGFIGLGHVGFHLASNLINAGYSLMVYDIKKERVKLLTDKGAVSVSSPKEFWEKRAY
jgi:3-hydroxyisobutyrate dehydrogenase-like beta-hydroxyacid dehydrogenase